MFFDENYKKKQKKNTAHYVSLQLSWPNRPLFLWSSQKGTLVGFEVWMQVSPKTRGLPLLKEVD